MNEKTSGVVYIEKALTKNMGKFNSARIAVGMTLPINFTEDDVVQAKRTARKLTTLVDERLEKEFEDLFESFGERLSTDLDEEPLKRRRR